MTHADRRDVVVVGLGSIGSMSLWQLARRGADVLGIEQFGRVHTYGAYAGESRLFRAAAKEGEVFIPALLRARELWHELGASYGQDPLLRVGALSVGPQGHPALTSTPPGSAPGTPSSTSRTTTSACSTPWAAPCGPSWRSWRRPSSR
jgi:sarcosine oxidase